MIRRKLSNVSKEYNFEKMDLLMGTFYLLPTKHYHCAYENSHEEIIADSVIMGLLPVVVVDLPLLRVSVEGSDNPVSLEKHCQASLPPDQQGRHSLGRQPEVQYIA